MEFFTKVTAPKASFKIDYTKNTQTIHFNKTEWIDWETPALR